MLEGRSVTVVVPAFAEEDNIARVIATMPRFVDRIVVVDDGSVDETSAQARAVCDPRVEIVRHRTRRGVGAAIVTGYTAALRSSSPTAPEDAFAVIERGGP